MVDWIINKLNMNFEVWLSYVLWAKWLLVAFMAFIASRAGRSAWKPLGFKVRRRIVLPVIAALGIILWSLAEKKYTPFLWVICSATVAIQFAVMSIFSYGSGSWLRPLGIPLQRAIVGAIIPACWVWLAIHYGGQTWIIYSLGIVVSSLVSCVMGYFNPSSASEEEGLIHGQEFIWSQFMV